MGNMVIFDSDFVIANISSLKEYLNKFSEYECYISDVSINEIAKHTSFDRLEAINDFKSKVKNQQNLGIEFKNDFEQMKKIIEDDTSKFVKKIFGDKTISNQLRESSLLLERAYNKIPPFGKSDKGFKDTIILLDIIDFFKDNSVKKAFLVTNDEDFNKNIEKIEKEVKEKTSCDFSIVDGKNIEKLLNFFNLGNSREIKKISEDIKKKSNIDVVELRNDLNEICEKLFYYEGFDPFDGIPFVEKNFIACKVISKKILKEFLDELGNNINRNIFNSSVTISDFFVDPFLFSKEHEISIDVFEKLNNIYLKIKDYEEYEDALLNLLFSNFYKLTKQTSDNLPF